MNIKTLIEILQKFPPDATFYAYEGESVGIVIRYKDKWGFIPCSELDTSKTPKIEYIDF